MQITKNIYATHIEEDPSSFGAMHPGGTHIYFVGDPQEEMVMVDSGEPYRSWTNQILGFYNELGRPKMSAILITHGHGDHIGGLDRLQEEFGCVVRCHPKLEPAMSHRLGQGTVEKLRSREMVTTGGGVRLRAYFTPGHEEDHICYHMAASKVLFTGDTILGNSSSSVRSLKDYMSSLRILAGLKPEMICPGHGQILNNGTARIETYIRHRTEREEQVLAALAEGVDSVEEIVSVVYPRNLRKNLRNAAARNVRTHLTKLTEEGRVNESEATYSLAKG
ncbi:MAG: MBL fold metallo-hydrolase [SAR202 cluster bacterium]|nr:MBL fold metallo-hydrolase [SAR202 cluster bacterium]|tara:strand:- start:345 stop:1178 length:834 start_codon:yes stop_codon:yes gene_type:complete